MCFLLYYFFFWILAILNLEYNENLKHRLDEFLSIQEAIHSRSFASRLIKKGNVQINGVVITKPSRKLQEGDCLEVTVEDLIKEITVLPEKVPFQIIYEDEDILVLDKPAGVVVHPGAGNWHGTLVSGLVDHWGKIPNGLDKNRPGIVHRLDKDTSGVMLVAKNSRAVAYYSDLFKQRKIQKKYLALIYGKLPQEKGEIITYIARHRIDRKKMTVVGAEKGRYSETHYNVKTYYQVPSDEKKLFTLVEISLKTGRTHQIRVHFQHLGYPLVGDPVYAGRKMKKLYPKMNRQLLLARSLQFVDSQGKERKFEVSLPKDFKGYIESLVEIGG